jgi:hypothetical protein
VVVAWICGVAEEYAQPTFVAIPGYLARYSGVYHVAEVHDAFVVSAFGSIPLASQFYIPFYAGNQMADSANNKPA